MDISNNGLNQPVSFYQKNTGNNINYAISGDNLLYTTNVFMKEAQAQNNISNQILQKPKRKNHSKRLNTVDTDYLPDFAEAEYDEKNTENSENFFLENKSKNMFKKFNNVIKFITSSIPLVNYFFLRNKEKTIKNTIIKLNDINQNVDEIINTTAPYGEEATLYDNLANNLSKAANIIGETNKKNW